MKSVVKQERHDEAEIQELAAKMMEANRVRMQAPVRSPAPSAAVQGVNILTFLSRNKITNDIVLTPIGGRMTPKFGSEQFTSRDLIVRLSDVIEFYNFLDACYTKLMNGSTNRLDRCGFIRINEESVVPYTVYSGEKYVPLFYFEGETDTLKLRADTLEGWDLSYLKFCCKVQGIRNELFSDDSCAVISLVDIRNYFPPGTLFEDYWPTKVVDSQLLINGKSENQAGQWIRQPTGQPIPHSHPPALTKMTTQTLPTNSLHNVQTLYTNYPLAGGQPSYPTLQPRAPNSTVRPSYPSTVPTPRQTHSSYYTSMAQAPPPLIRSNQQ
ncbi:hypothetical protein FQR65_LT02796 [Abscondita terminalis]|nr:hypothetical protein FQR65_LT02796 [Abscondita terminalis]